LPISRNIGGAKGRIFEIIIRKLLKKNEYEPCKVDEEQVDSQGRVRGRGEWHQIDALGRWKYALPFIYPIRLICEAKCWNKPVGLTVVRNFVGAIKDISENYFVEDNQDIDKRMFSKRYTDCGAIFSFSGFTKPAQRYAYAQGIFLISYKDNPIIDALVKNVEKLSPFVRLPIRANKKRFSEWFERTWSTNEISDEYSVDRQQYTYSLRALKAGFLKVRTSVIGIATGVYPLHLLSFHALPYDLFANTDETFFRVTYSRTNLGGHYFEVYPSDNPEVRFYFTIPEIILSKYTDSMKRFKREFLKWIDFPITMGGIRRILRFNLDTEWLRSLR